MTKGELELAVAFARLELLELDHGKRALTECPGVLVVASAIREANLHRPCGCRAPQLTPDSTTCCHCGGFTR